MKVNLNVEEKLTWIISIVKWTSLPLYLKSNKDQINERGLNQCSRNENISHRQEAQL